MGTGVSVVAVGADKEIVFILIAGYKGGDNLRHYQCKRGNPYQLPHNVYMQCLYLIRDYDRLKKMVQDISPTEPLHQAAFMRCEAIEQALMTIPHEYKTGVFNNVMYGCGYPIDASHTTYGNWRRRFIYELSQKMKML